MIHYHGTPMTPRSKLLPMAGKHFCVSFADKRDGDWCLLNAQSVMWDNGAFTMFTKKLIATTAIKICNIFIILFF